MKKLTKYYVPHAKFPCPRTTPLDCRILLAALGEFDEKGTQGPAPKIRATQFGGNYGDAIEAIRAVAYRGWMFYNLTGRDEFHDCGDIWQLDQYTRRSVGDTDECRAWRKACAARGITP